MSDVSAIAEQWRDSGSTSETASRVVLPAAAKRDEEFVKMPRITLWPAPVPQRASVGRPERQAPLTDRLVGDGDTPLEVSGETRDQARKTLEIDPTYIGGYQLLVVAHIGAGEHEEALNACTRGLKRLTNDRVLLSYYGLVCGMMGRRREAENTVARLQQHRRDGYFPATRIALCYVGLGDIDQALAWLNTAYDERDGLCLYLDRWPLFDPLRADLRFQALLQKMNFPPAASPELPSSGA